MSRALAIIVNDVVENVFLGDPAQYPDAVDVTDVSPRPCPGWRKTATGYEAPTESAPAPVFDKMTTLAFENRFTEAESIRIERAATDVPATTATEEERNQAANLRVAIRKSMKATYIDPALDTTRGYVAMLSRAGLLDRVQNGVLYTDRVSEILDAPITEAEAFRG